MRVETPYWQVVDKYEIAYTDVRSKNTRRFPNLTLDKLGIQCKATARSIAVVLLQTIFLHALHAAMQQKWETRERVLIFPAVFAFDWLLLTKQNS
jgi:hypothetical protein